MKTGGRCSHSLRIGVTMLYCDKCAETKDFPKSYMKSPGLCEVCGEGAVCNNVPYSFKKEVKQCQFK